MVSNIYLAAGFLDDTPVMKVGKANGIEQRQRQIRIAIELFHECEDEAQAFNLERRLRWFMLNEGAIRIEGTIDWFAFDADIYKRARAFLEGSLGFQLIQEYTKHSKVEDVEIAAFQRRYHKLIGKEEPAPYKSAHQQALEERREAFKRYHQLSPELKQTPYIADAYWRLRKTSKDDIENFKSAAKLNLYINLINDGIILHGSPYDM